MPLKLNSDLPSLAGATEWINGMIDTKSLIGKPTIIHFWAVSCYLCKKNLPVLQEWQQTLGDDLQIVSVHMPRQKEDTDIDAVKKMIEELIITEPCAIDNAHKVKDAFQNDQSWVPAYFLFDAEGKLRSRTAGDTGLTMMKGALDRLLPKTSMEEAQAAA